MSHPLVVHCKKSAYDIYIGRPSIWGNPWMIGAEGTREEVIERYRTWLDTGRDFGHPEATADRRTYILEHVSELKGKTLGCWCGKLPCHGDILAEIANQTVES